MTSTHAIAPQTQNYIYALVALELLSWICSLQLPDHTNRAIHKYLRLAAILIPLLQRPDLKVYNEHNPTSPRQKPSRQARTLLLNDNIQRGAVSNQDRVHAQLTGEDTKSLDDFRAASHLVYVHGQASVRRRRVCSLARGRRSAHWCAEWVLLVDGTPQSPGGGAPPPAGSQPPTPWPAGGWPGASSCTC